MKSFRLLTTIACLLLLSSMLLACGAEKTETGNTGNTGSQAASTDANGLPIFPGAKAPEANDPMTMVINTTKQQLQSQQADATVEAYVLPADASFDKVKQFYNDNLKAPWKSAESIAGAAAANPMAAIWMQDNGTSFTVTSVPGVSGQNVIMTMYVGTN